MITGVDFVSKKRKLMKMLKHEKRFEHEGFERLCDQEEYWSEPCVQVFRTNPAPPARLE